ncbi:FAD binding domain-containing protein [Actinomadura madurae]|uniref:FAD binding domain-containing protein n=1 Tax=Actinomadura madurae TaxID=1993 RepID=UPI0024E22278|nr:FAD binding domain-containing protein [Actinomadura madurae]
MYPFSYLKVDSQSAAVAAADRGGRFIAGGTTLVDLMREEVERPEALIDISALPMRAITTTPAEACASARWRRWPTSPPILASERLSRLSRRPSN